MTLFECICGNIWSTRRELTYCKCRICGQYVEADDSDESDTSDTSEEEFIPEKNVKYFGEYQCPKCLRGWYSAHAWLGYGQQCKKCLIYVKPHELTPLRKSDKEDPKRPHETDKCSKCDKLGYNCSRISRN